MLLLFGERMNGTVKLKSFTQKRESRFHFLTATGSNNGRIQTEKIENYCATSAAKIKRGV